MFIALLAATLVIALAVSAAVVQIFNKPMDRILQRLVPEQISTAWLKYLKFAILVVGVSSGVRIWDLEKYITPPRYPQEASVIELTGERWVLEVYRTVIGALQGIAWLLLVFFIFALIAYVIVRIFELRRTKSEAS